MASRIKLNNNQGDTITLEHSDTISSLGSRVIPLDNITHKVSTIAELRAMTERPEFVYVEAYDDSGSTYGAFGSHFFKRSLVVVADNGGTVIQSVNDTYELQYSGAVNAKWFGAVGDGITDDSAAIDTALRYIESLGGGTLNFEHKTYKCIANAATYDSYNIFVIASNTIIEGNGAIFDIVRDGTNTNLRVFENKNSGTVGLTTPVKSKPDLTNQDSNIIIKNVNMVELDGLNLNFIGFYFRNCKNVSLESIKTNMLWDTEDERGMGGVLINTACTNFLISNCLFNVRYGIWIRNDYDDTVTAYSSDYDIRGINVVDNTINYQGDEWGLVHGNGGHCYDVTFNNNVINAPYSVTQGGAILHTGFTIYDRDDIATGFTYTTPTVKGVKLINNTFNTTEDRFFCNIEKSVTAGSISNIIIKGNIIDSAVYGFSKISGSSDVIVESNIMNDGGVGNIGIVRVINSTNVSIIGNQFKNCHCEDDEYLLNIDVDSSECVFSNNLVEMRATTGGETKRNGIRLLGSNLTISNNQFKNIQYWALLANGTNHNIDGNSIIGTSARAIIAHSLSLDSIINNNIVDGAGEGFRGYLGMESVMVHNNIFNNLTSSPITGDYDVELNSVRNNVRDYLPQNTTQVYDSAPVIRLTALPTTDPLLANQLWNNAGVLTVSAG